MHRCTKAIQNQISLTDPGDPSPAKTSTSTTFWKADPGLKHRYFSRHIRQTRGSATATQTRWELQLPRNNVTQRALEEVLGGGNTSGWSCSSIIWGWVETYDTS